MRNVIMIQSEAGSFRYLSRKPSTAKAARPCRHQRGCAAGCAVRSGSLSWLPCSRVHGNRVLSRQSLLLRKGWPTLNPLRHMPCSSKI
jgi:hypothetical protein